MKQKYQPLAQAFDEVSAHSAGGSPFLLAYGTTFMITALLSLVLPEEITAMIAMFQGGLALPAALWLERRLGWGRMSADNPLRPLSKLMALSQTLALPAFIVAFSLNPRSLPVILAALGGVHFLPYAWLHRSRWYVYLSVAVAVGAFGLQLLLGPAAFHANLFLVGGVYLITAPLVYREAAEWAKPALSEAR